MSHYGFNPNASVQPERKVILKHDLDLVRLKQSIDSSLEKFGRHPWRTAESASMKYSGFSLTYNPHHQENIDPNASSLGTANNKRTEFYYGSIQNHADIKNSYFDSYSFIKRTPAASEGYLSEILDSCKRTLIRGRMMILDGSFFDEQTIAEHAQADERDSRYGWHRDETVFENLRINIPITGSEAFVFEMKGEAPYFLKPGLAYSWDTNIPHRVWCRERTNAQRYNLIIGVSPWFDYDSIQQAWRPNAYFKKVSPLEMLKQGLVFDWLKP